MSAASDCGRTGEGAPRSSEARPASRSSAERFPGCRALVTGAGSGIGTTIDRTADGDRQRWEPVWGAFHTLGRCGEPDEVAQAVAFLGNPQSSFITGTDLSVDGGYLAMGPERSYGLETSPTLSGHGGAA